MFTFSTSQRYHQLAFHVLSGDFSPWLPPTHTLLSQSIVNQPSNSHVFPVIIQQLACSYQRTHWIVSLLKVTIIDPCHLERQVHLFFAVLAPMVPSFSLHFSSMPSIWRSLASCQPMTVYAAPSLPHPDLLESSSCFLIFVFRHVAELLEWNSTKHRCLQKAQQPGIYKYTSKQSNHSENLSGDKIHGMGQGQRWPGLLLSVIFPWLKLLFWGQWGLLFWYDHRMEGGLTRRYPGTKKNLPKNIPVCSRHGVT